MTTILPIIFHVKKKKNNNLYKKFATYEHQEN